MHFKDEFENELCDNNVWGQFVEDPIDEIS